MKTRNSARSIFYTRTARNSCCCYCCTFFYCIFRESEHSIIENGANGHFVFLLVVQCDPYEILIMLLIKRSYNVHAQAATFGTAKSWIERFLLFGFFFFLLSKNMNCCSSRWTCRKKQKRQKETKILRFLLKTSTPRKLKWIRCVIIGMRVVWKL